MNNNKQHNHRSDMRMLVYKSIKQLFVFIILLFIVKFTVCDTVSIKTNQMEPAIKYGDRIFLIKLPYIPPFNYFLSPDRKDIIIFKHPHINKKKLCLRIAGKFGDVVTVQNGIFSVIDHPEFSIFTNNKSEENYPAEYSPRDNLESFGIHGKGDTIFTDSVKNIRDLIFLYSMIKQENIDKDYSIRALLYINDSLVNNYNIKDFALFKGNIRDIPDSLYTNWFFWDRLDYYLSSTLEEDHVYFTVSITHNGVAIDRYVLKTNFYFLISDNWQIGFDSRYFGPISSNFIKGRVAGILWSVSPGKSLFKKLRKKRIFRFIK